MKDNVAPAPVKVGAVDVEAFAKNLARMVEEGGKALAAYLKPREEGQIEPGLSDEMTDMVKTFGEVAELLAVRSQPRGRTAVAARQGLSRPLGRRGQTAVRRERRAGRSRPTRRTSASPIRNGRRTSSSTSSSRPICSSTRLGGPSGQGRRGPRPAHPPEGRVLRQADRQRAVAVELRADQSGTAARDARLQRREPGARHAHAGRGHRGRRRRPQDPPVGCGEVRGRRAISRSRPAR